MMFSQAPELSTSDWLNVDTPLSLEKLRGKVIVIEAFQMLCPGCVSHGLPLMDKVRTTFRFEDVAIIGLHAVFEHHAVQGSREALKAFAHEYRIFFPLAIDKPSESDPLPETMRAYRMRGTPTLILIDREGRLRKQYFGTVSEMALGAEIMSLVQEATPVTVESATKEDGENCDASGCLVRKA